MRNHFTVLETVPNLDALKHIEPKFLNAKKAIISSSYLKLTFEGQKVKLVSLKLKKTAVFSLTFTVTFKIGRTAGRSQNPLQRSLVQRDTLFYFGKRLSCIWKW